MEKTLRVLNRMVKDGVIEQYAIVVQWQRSFNIEPINTTIWIFSSMCRSKRWLDILAPLYTYLSRLGYKGKGEAIEIEGWPFSSFAIFNPLLEEAVEQAKEIRFQRTKTRVCRRNIYSHHAGRR